MIKNGTIKEDANRVVWESAPLPNEVVAVRKGLSDDMAKKLQDAFVAITNEEIAKQLPSLSIHRLHRGHGRALRNAGADGVRTRRLEEAELSIIRQGRGGGRPDCSRRPDMRNALIAPHATISS